MNKLVNKLVLLNCRPNQPVDSAPLVVHPRCQLLDRASSRHTYRPHDSSLAPVTGNLYVLEGPDGVGKTTLAECMHAYLDQHGIAHVSCSFPGCEKGTLGELAYRLYHRPSEFGISSLGVIAEQVMMTSAHADVIERRIRSAISEGKHVVLDRYWWSTWVYSKAKGLDAKILDQLIELELSIWGEIKPAVVFLVRRDWSEHSKQEFGFWSRLVSLYDEIGTREASRVRVLEVDNRGRLDKATRTIMASVNASLCIQSREQ